MKKNRKKLAMLSSVVLIIAAGLFMLNQESLLSLLKLNPLAKPMTLDERIQLQKSLVSAEAREQVPFTLEENRQLMAKELACVPEKPLDKGKLFALAMQDYFKVEMRRLWTRDEIYSGFHSISVSRAKKGCGLIRDDKGFPLKISRKACYPWKIEKYSTLDKLVARMQAARSDWDLPQSTTEEILVNVLDGTMYQPKKEQLYLPQHNNRNTGFAVLMNLGTEAKWYPEDCCRLMKYPEYLKEEAEVTASARYRPLTASSTKLFPPGTQLDDLYYLRVKFKYINTKESGEIYIAYDENRVDDFYEYYYYPVSPCGTLMDLNSLYIDIDDVE